jgi:hypothetical protein
VIGNEKAVILVLAALFVGTAAFAAVDKPAKVKASKMNGTIIDNMCAAGHQADIAEFVKAHTKECALMPTCVASGYSLYTEEGKLVAFDDASNAKIKKFLDKKKSSLQVVVKAKMMGDKLSLVSIENKKMPKPAKKGK